MKFDHLWKDEGPVTDAANLPLPPDGVWVGTIAAAEDATKPWLKNDANPDGECLSVVVQLPGFAPVTENVPAHFRGKVCAVCRAAGLPEPGPEGFEEAALVGRRVGVLTEQRTAKSGKRYAAVVRWYSAAEAADHPPAVAAGKPGQPPAAVGPRTPRKPKTEPTGDDIPF